MSKLPLNVLDLLRQRSVEGERIEYKSGRIATTAGQWSPPWIWRPPRKGWSIKDYTEVERLSFLHQLAARGWTIVKPAAAMRNITGSHGRPTPGPALTALAWLLLPCAALAQQPEADPAHTTNFLRPIIITGASSDNQRWTAPVSMDIIEGDEIRAGQLQVNLSESLGRVPGLTLQNRQNYAQDLQVSIRGFGARSTFGVRGIRLFVDGIPASAPDGQGQTANFPLGSADRIEVIRGPYSALYGSSSGGVIALYTADGGPSEWRLGTAFGADGLWRLSTQANGQVGSYHYAVEASSFSTDGYRPQSAAERESARLKLLRTHEDSRIVMLLDSQVSQALDPLGLSRAEFDANARQTTATATLFNTRKSVQQTQLGLGVQQRLGGGHQLELMGYAGQRALIQYQAIPAATQAAAGSPGGVIDLGRRYGGLNARWRLDRQYEGGKLTASAGIAMDRQDEDRRGFENFQGATLGVQGRLRRDETNRATTLDPYAQLEWENAAWTATAGVRRSRVKLSSADRYIAPGNPDDGGAVTYSATNPVLGLRYKLSPSLQAYASWGKGFETPTLNEVAYRAFGGAGLNTNLAASRSRSVEAGLRGRNGSRAWTATVFDIVTQDEIVVLSNTAGRSTYQNAGRTRRRGLELSGEAALGKFTFSSALTWLNATYADAFTTCDSAPCAGPSVRIPAGNRLPGIARQQAYVQVAWEPGWAGSTFTLELRHSGNIAVNDRNSDAAAAYTVANLGTRFQQDSGPWRMREFMRVDNLTRRSYAGSVIVNEGSGRFFETAPGRSIYVGLELVKRFD